MENGEKDYKKLYEEALLTLSEKEEIISDQQFELDKLRRHLFGFRSEKRTNNVGDDQLGLFELGTTKSVQEELSGSMTVAEKPTPKKRAKGTGRMSLPEELRREEVVIEPSESTEGCTRIGEEVTEVLEVVPASFYVKRYVRPKYARPNGESIIIGTLPDRLIEKGIPSESVIAQMTVDKYVYGMPLHRQIDKYTKMGVRIPASSEYVLHGQMEIDNNLVENAVRPLVVGRKAYLFVGSHQAAEMTAAMYSFMESCKNNKIKEFNWLKDVFERIQSHKQKDLYQLLQSNWEGYRPK
jgi:transposase